MKVTKIENKDNEYVYDISLDGTFVNALGSNIMSNTDGFNFRMPSVFRYTESLIEPVYWKRFRAKRRKR